MGCAILKERRREDTSHERIQVMSSRSEVIKWAIKRFDSLDKRDFENGAVLDNIRRHLQYGEKAEAECDRLHRENDTLKGLLLAIKNDTTAALGEKEKTK